MNRNEVLEAMANAIKDDHEGTCEFVVAMNMETAELALSALEAIMERDGLKLLASDSYPKNAADLDKVMYRTHFDQAKCKLKGGE